MLTTAKVKALEPREKRYMIADGHGLSLEVQPSGLKSWRSRFTLRGRAGKLNLGHWPHLSLADARKRHSELKKGVADGKSPADQRRAQQQAEMRGSTVEQFADMWLKRHVSRARKDLAPIRRYLARDVFPTIGIMPVAMVEKKDFRAMIDAKIDAGHPQAALALRNILKRLWDYAVECELTEKATDAVIPKTKYVAEVSRRSRALKPAEVAAFLAGLAAAKLKDELKDAFALILLTLVRKGELRRARWAEFDLERGEWALPEEHSKTDMPLVIPLSRQAVAILRRQRARHSGASVVFPMRGALHTPMAASTLNKALARIALKIEHFTVHDLRRTGATNLSELEYDERWVEKALNHNKKGVAGIYNRAQYAAQRRVMLQAWADWLDNLKTNKGKG
jgi:integrase